MFSTTSYPTVSSDSNSDIKVEAQSLYAVFVWRSPFKLRKPHDPSKDAVQAEILPEAKRPLDLPLSTSCRSWSLRERSIGREAVG